MFQFFVSLNARGNSVYQKKTAPTSVENITFIRKMNRPMMVIQATLFPR